MRNDVEDVNTVQGPVAGKVNHLDGYEARIAEIAYYKAEKRGFEPGHEQEDWYAAKKEFLGFE